MKKKNLVFYHFFQKDQEYITNLAHFLEFGYEPESDFVIILAGNCSIEKVEARNIKYIFAENKNNDFGGYCTALSRISNLDEYSNFLFINSSVRGPFVIDNNRSWTQCFTDLLDEQTGIVGSTINILSSKSAESQNYEKKTNAEPPYSHVQTTAYALNLNTLKSLIKEGFFNERAELCKEDVVADYEIALSQKILDLGLNLKCLVPEYNQIDYRNAHTDINPTSVNGDILLRSAYFGRTIHPYEAMYIKTNRNLYLDSYLDRLAASAYVKKGGKNYLNSKEIFEYRCRMDETLMSTNRINHQSLNLKPNEVLELTKKLIKHYPNAANHLIETINGNSINKL